MSFGAGGAVSYGRKLESATVGDKHRLFHFLLMGVELSSLHFVLEDPVHVSQPYDMGWRICLCPAGHHQRHRRSTPFSAGGHLQWCDRTLVEAVSL